MKATSLVRTKQCGSCLFLQMVSTGTGDEYTQRECEEDCLTVTELPNEKHEKKSRGSEKGMRGVAGIMKCVSSDSDFA